MAEVKLTNVDTVVSQNNKSLNVDKVAALTENIGSASHGDSLIFASGSWTTGQVQTSGGGSGGTVLGDTGIDVSSQTINGVTDYFYEYGSAPTLDLNIVAPQDQQALVYDQANDQWINANVSSSGGTSTIDGATDTQITSPTNNQVLSYDNVLGKWVNSTIASSGGGTAITDVGISFSQVGSDNIWEVDATPDPAAFTVQKDDSAGDGSIDFIFPTNPN